jgi:hypothetical protein
MDNKVYIVIAINFDYMEIDKVFSTREKAEHYIKNTHYSSFVLDIEEWEIN